MNHYFHIPNPKLLLEPPHHFIFPYHFNHAFLMQNNIALYTAKCQYFFMCTLYHVNHSDWGGRASTRTFASLRASFSSRPALQHEPCPKPCCWAADALAAVAAEPCLGRFALGCIAPLPARLADELAVSAGGRCTAALDVLLASRRVCKGGARHMPR